MSKLQWRYAGSKGDSYFTDVSKCEPKYEAEASWSTPDGPGRYRIWMRNYRGFGGTFDVVRLKPSRQTFEGRPQKFSGRLLATSLRDMNEAYAIAAADDARLRSELSSTAADRETPAAQSTQPDTTEGSMP